MVVTSFSNLYLVTASASYIVWCSLNIELHLTCVIVIVVYCNCWKSFVEDLIAFDEEANAIGI
jgi:hypothetical protein